MREKRTSPVGPGGIANPLRALSLDELHDLGAQLAFDLLADTRPQPRCRRCHIYRPSLHGLCESCLDLLADLIGEGVGVAA